ncbi:MAG: hypothetical protein NC311_07030 [Muribaculaceae bacterium]|nr:hypothetical protein [Muribaculaceae bacterium]MCM1458826.1 hypothetical protein [Bacteroides sp.]
MNQPSKSATQNGQTSEEETIKSREKLLSERLKKLEEMEQDVKDRERLLKEKEKAKKQVLLRLSPSLWQELASWADEDYRSINSQIEFLLSECVRKRKKI